MEIDTEAFDQNENECSEESDNSETNANSKRIKSIENKKMRKKLKSELFKAPTNEELNRLRETENLFNSSLFRMQIEEMLNEINIKQKRIAEFQNWFKEFETFIEDLHEYDDVLMSKLCKKEKKTKQNKFINNLLNNKFNYLQTDQDLKLKFIKPESYTTFGLYKIQSALKNFMDFNINITMPRLCFNLKDYINNRYFVKRYYYLLYIATELNRSNICKNISFGYFHGNELLPIIIVVPKLYDKIKIQIIFTPPKDYFKLSRFDMDKNNVKVAVYDNISNIAIENINNKTTAFYNATLLHDITVHENSNEIEKRFQDLKNVQDALKLLIVWLTQRNLNNSFISFHNNLMVYVLMYSLVKRKINKSMSSYQIVRIMWNFIASTDWTEKPVSICEDVKENDLQQYKKYYEVTFLDFTGHFNIMAFLNQNYYYKLKNESTLAVKYLDNNQMNSFDALFMTKMPISLQYDTILSIQDDNNFDVINKLATEEDNFNFMGYYKEMICKIITNYLKKGLNKRINNIVPYYQYKEITWEMGLVKDETFNKIIFGVNLNSEFAFSPLELGPPEFDEKAEEFRKFWGDLCELRRFTDNKICEAVYFKCERIQDRRQVFKKMIDYIINKKLKLKYKLIADEFENILKLKNVILPYPVGTNEEICLKIKNSFDKLRDKLREIKIQLGITSIHGSSQVFSYTDPFPPIPSNYRCGKKITTEIGNNIVLKSDISLGIAPRHVVPIKCVFQLARDSKWPNDLNALRCIITEFYFEISNLLKKDFNIVSKVKSDHMDVLFEGLVFRLKLYQQKEILLLKKYINEEGLLAYKDTKESLELEKELNILPSFIGALNGLMLQFPSYGPSTCLIKRWMRSQLIDDFHFPDIAIDLLNASLFVQSAPYNSANLPQIAFLRFLKFISEYDFVNQPIAINFNERLTSEELNEIQTDFQQNRSKYPPVFIITPYDDMKSIFTLRTPTNIILQRVSILALETYKFTDNCIMGPGQLHVTELFVPNIQGYNVIIYLNPLLIPRKYQSVKASNLPLEIEDFDEKRVSKIPVVNFDPVQNYLRDLRASYDKFAIFFYDTYGGSFIGVLWKPDVFNEREFKVLQVDCQKLLNNKLIFNKNAAIEDFYILGKGLVKTIDVV